MSDRRETFSVGSRPRLELRLATGDLRVLPGPAETIDITIRGNKPEMVVVEQMGDTVVIRQETGRWTAGSFEISVRAPAGLGVEASLASTNLLIEVDLSDLQVSVASGDVRAGRVGRDVGVKSASGDVRINEVGGKLQATSVSGVLAVGVISGNSSFSTASGDIVIGLAEGDVAVKSASGDVRIDEYCGSDLRGRTVSGDMQVGLAGGQRVDVDLQSLTGNLRLPSTPSPTGAGDKPTIRVSFRSVSGDFELLRTPRRDKS